MKILVISDLHWKPDGQQLTRVTAEAASGYLQSRLDRDIDAIVMNGDIHGLWTGRSLADKQEHWRRIKRQNPGWYEWLTAKITTGRVIYVVGNHDLAIDREDWMHPVFKEFNLFDGKRYIHFEHGHQGDWFNSRGIAASRAITWVGGWVSRLPGVDKDRLWSMFFRLFESGRDQRAGRFRNFWLNEARVHGWDMVCTGHTHHEEIKTEALGRVFANSGTWIQRNALPLLVIDNGRPFLEYRDLEVVKKVG